MTRIPSCESEGGGEVASNKYTVDYAIKDKYYVAFSNCPIVQYIDCK